MRKAIISVICTLTLLAYAIPYSYGQGTNIQTGREETPKVITTAVPFLIVAPDSRHGGMGEAGVALANDATATHWNPSALSFIDRQMGFSMSYSPWLRALGIPDINLMYLSGYLKTGKTGTVGASLRYFSLGEIDFTNIQGDYTGTDKPNELALDVAYSLKVSDQLSAAISLRYLNSRLTSGNGPDETNRTVNSAAGDISLFYTKDFTISGASDLPVQFSSGLHISNIGPKISYSPTKDLRDFIPTNLRVGYAFKFFLDDYNSLTFTNDFNKLLVPSPRDSGVNVREIPLLEGVFSSFGDADGGFGEELQEINISVGAEYWYRNLFAARAGFFYESPNKGNRRFITLGAGVKYNVFGLDFSYLAPIQQNHPLQNTLRFTLTYDFESAGNN
ncbi:MAG: type IX secretion system outer membrane channel protein PorV [Bacteroidota bacterium]